MELSHGGDWAGYEREYSVPLLDFSANVSPLGIPEKVRQAAVRALDRADRYPDPLCRELREKLSERHSVPADWILCGNGAGAGEGAQNGVGISPDIFRVRKRPDPVRLLRDTLPAPP